MRAGRRERRGGHRIRAYLTPPPPVSVTRGDDEGVHVVTTRAGSFTLDVSRVPSPSRAWFLKTAPDYPWPAGCLVWVGRHGQWHVCWDLRGGLRFASYFPGDACQMMLTATAAS